MQLKPFFCYYGGKFRAAPRYLAPVYDRVIEPFAGAAGYAIRYPDRDVLLVDIDPLIAGLWRYLTKVSAAEILALPAHVEHVDEIKGPEEAKWLVGFWMNKGVSSPRKSASKWMRDGVRPASFWGAEIRSRIAEQLPYIRHWDVREASYETLANEPGTWFIDPPYQVAGQHYRSNTIDYGALSAWCQSRQGQVIVCENVGADWLPFEPFARIKGTPGANGGQTSDEALWYRTDSTSVLDMFDGLDDT